MQAERDAIRNFVNPTLKALCAKRGLFFHSVDLRWGIDEGACRRGEVLLLCLREVRRSTHFVGVLKARYGWHLRPGAPADDAGNALFRLNLARAAGEFPAIKGWEHCSVTEIEMRAGVLGGAAQLQAMRARSLFFVAGPGLMRAEGGEGPEPERRLEALKGEIRAAGLPVAEFERPDGLAADMRDALARMLERDYPPDQERPWLEAERAQHEAFAASRQRVFVRNAEDMAALSEYAAGAGPEILVLHGEGGCGKSALLANWAVGWSGLYPDDLVVMHFIGGSQSSSRLENIARRVSEEVRGRWPDAEALDLRGTDAELAPRLRAFLTVGAARWPARVVLALDGLDQLRGDERHAHAVRGLVWLPAAAGPRLRILVSSPRGPALDAALAAECPHVAREITPLDEARRRNLVGEVLLEQGRALSGERVDRIVRAEACRNALFLTTPLNELSNASVHAKLDADIGALLGCGSEPRDLFRLLFGRLAARHGAGVVRTAAAAIACSRHGMAEGELKAFVGVDEAGGPSQVAWGLLWHDFLELVVCRDGLHAFFHRCTAEAAELECGLAGADGSDAARAAVHARLGDFFAQQPASQRRAEEAPWALARGGADCSGRLVDILCDADVLARLDPYEMVGLWLASGRPEEAAGRYAAALRRGGEGADAGDLERAGSLLETMGRHADAIPFLEEALRLRKEALGPEHLEIAAALSRLAKSQRAKGDYAAARPLLEEALRLRKAALGRGHVEVAGATQELASLLLALGEYASGFFLLEARLCGHRNAQSGNPGRGARMLCWMLRRSRAGAPGPTRRRRRRCGYGGRRRRGRARRRRRRRRWPRRRACSSRRASTRKQGPRTKCPPSTPEANQGERGGESRSFASTARGGSDVRALCNRRQDALQLQKRALGPEHPEVASTLYSLGSLSIARGDCVSARPFFEARPGRTGRWRACFRPVPPQEALRLRKKALGPEHPTVAGSMQSLALTLYAENDHAGARSLYEEVLRLRRKALGPEHPSVASTLEDLGNVLERLGTTRPRGPRCRRRCGCGRRRRGRSTRRPPSR